MKKNRLSSSSIEYRLPMSSDFYASGDEIILTMETYASETFRVLHENIDDGNELDSFESASLHEVLEDFADSLNVSRFIRNQLKRNAS